MKGREVQGLLSVLTIHSNVRLLLESILELETGTGTERELIE